VDESSTTEPAIPPTRLVALGDGVFAIVMTLLVFQLTVPVLAEDQTLPEALLDMWPDFAMYMLSFLVLGVFWVIHHVLFDVIQRYDTTLVWLNIGFLMFAALVPFSTGLFTEHGATTATAVVYGLTMMSVFATGWAIFSYATRDRRLVAADLDEGLIKGGRLMGMAYMAFMVPSLAVSLLSPTASFVLYGVMVLTIIVATLVGRGEVVLLWPTGRAARGDEAAARGDEAAARGDRVAAGTHPTARS
jgi:uncharacterized membrane protein